MARTLFIANKTYSSWSLRPWVLMRSRGLDFKEVLTPFEADNAERFGAFSPNARVPALHDGDRIVWDSLAIVEYLAEDDAGVWPADRDARAYARSAAAEMHSGFAVLRERCPMVCNVQVRLHADDPALTRDVERIDAIFATGLERFGGPFLAGTTFSAADAFFCPVAFRVQTYGLPLSDASRAYVDRLLDLDAMREWAEAAKAEPWREPGHEADIARVGVVSADSRTG